MTSEEEPGTLEVAACRMQEALAIVVKGRRKRFPVTLYHDSAVGFLDVFEARHSAASVRIPALGSWPGAPTVDGFTLRKVFATYGDDEIIRLVLDRTIFALVKDRSRIPVKLDDFEERPAPRPAPPPDPRHRGPVEVPPDPHEKRFEWDHTWLFSARMPIPQHRSENDGDD